MTAPRGKIEASLAERGRPVMWANEAEAAALSGVGEVTFRMKVRSWEAKGFPQVNPENGKRWVPAILNYWSPRIDFAPASVTESLPDQSALENFGGKSQRRA